MGMARVDSGDNYVSEFLEIIRAFFLLARKTAAQHQDNRRAFVTTNGCFPSKATKFSSAKRQNGKVDPNPRAARAWQRRTKKNEK
jgi:hypothetical protein